MSEVTAGSLTLYYNGVKAGHFTREKWKGKLKKAEWRCHGVVKNQMTVKPTTYSSRISTDIPLFESPGASFDQYLEDKPRVFKAIFPDKRRSHQLNEEEWRIQMLPINFLFLTVWPTVDMRLRCKSGGRDYPPQVPSDITKVLQLDIIKWELRGLDNVLEPAHFALGVKGALYPDRRGARSRLKGRLEMNISFVLPPVLALIPEDVRRSVAESVLTRLVENMKDKVNGNLLADYGEFKRKRPKNLQV
ncbi:hypothetical protein HS088_TW15G01065 [Tripterygium wilfordii]|uniref:DUF1997 family protein n=1 Tax=Tripterygium wilfordii TaxID=458696 RepID=A0A7J7CN94_TRIWF|nr:uncharacterized protein LOC120016147 [Tripterygium wilfordii]XP_038724703.1 uncharacterized protein LOC120016147 [Tripterygium wilfordii]KAF5735557.1 hypothetical protein HS088_TW15G01065 [Tripterygium wilfordii]